MLVLISPAKNLDFTPVDQFDSTQPLFTKEPEKLIKKLRKFKPAQIGELMSLSAKLSDLNYERYQNFKFEEGQGELKQAALAFNGEVYSGLKAEEYTAEDVAYAQDHLRILSGLYGLLRPMDLIQPYRLEMGTKLNIDTNTPNLYKFWQKKITKEINTLLKDNESSTIFNLASNEYFKAVDQKTLKADIYSAVFKENKNGMYKPIMVFAKKARGLMASFIVQNQITNPEDVKSFDIDGYQFNESLSAEKEFVFTRG